MKKMLLIVAMALVTFACSNEEVPKEKNIKIGLCADTFANLWPTYLYGAIEARIEEEEGVELTILDAKNDISTQLSQVENLITTGHDAIMVVAIDDASFGNMGRMTQDAGVLLIAVNRLPREEDMPYVDFYVGIDEKDAGIAAGKQFIADLEAEGRLNEEMGVGIVQGTLGQAGTIGRTEGFIETLAGYPNLKITRNGTAKWDRGLAINLVENWLQADIDNKLKAIFANSDEMAIGAILAIKQFGRDDIKVYGVDASPAGVDAIGNGLSATIEQDPIAMGRAAVDITLKKIRGESLDNLIDGKFKYIPLNIVTIKNREEFLKKIENIKSQ